MRILLGGSPCTHWSIAQTKNRETKPEGLGWELFLNYLIALEKYQPRYFLYENNKSMSPAIRAQITSELGVEPILINSALVSAQNRQRLYWTNIPGIQQPEDRGILLRDILESGVCWKEKAYTLKASIGQHGGLYSVLKTIKEPGKFPFNGAAEPMRIGTIESDTKNADFDSQQYRVYSPDGKSATLCGNGGGVGAKTGLYATPVSVEPIDTDEIGHACVGFRNRREADGKLYRRFEGGDRQKTHTLTTHLTDCMVAEPVKIALRVGDMPNAAGEISGSQSGRIYSADGKSVPLQARPNGGGADGAAAGLYAVPAGMAWRGRGDSSSYEMRDDQKANAVTADGHQSRLVIEAADGKTYPVYEVRGGQITIKGERYPIKLEDGFYIIRKLTVRECMRLQTVPEDYIFPVSDTQAYKMLGNGWTVDVIAHILSYMPGIASVPLEVLSMYDGMSCGRLALNKLGAHVRRYYATEIDKYAVKTTQANFPDTVQLGDAFQVRDAGWRLEGTPRRRRAAEEAPVQLEINFAGRQLWQ